MQQVEDIKREAAGFFREFLQHKPIDFEGIEIARLEEIMPRCRNEDHLMLTRPVGIEEIKGVLFAMPNDKSPGPDGYTTEFFKKSWSVVGNEFVIAVQERLPPKRS